MDIAKTIDHCGLTIDIVYDIDPIDPIKEWDMFGTMVTAHRRYNLGHKQYRYSEDIQEAQAELEAEGAIILPLYLYDHSGITMSTSPFSCPWDSGQVGFIYATREKTLKEFGKKLITKKVREKAIACMVSEVKAYDQYLTGDVYGFIIKDSEGEELDSCWGFYGIEHCQSEAQASAECFANKAA